MATSSFQAPLRVAATVSSATAVLTAGTHVPISAATVAVTASLPTGAHEGARISVEKQDATTNLVTMTGSIRGAAGTFTLQWRFEHVTFIADANGSWWPTAHGFARSDPTNRQNHIGTQPASTLSDASTVGLGVLTAADQATARTAMGAASLVVLEAADPNPATFLANTVYLRKVTDPSIRTIGVAASGNVSTLDYVVPSDAIVGDVLVLVTVAGNNALTTPAGWTLRQSPITPTTTNQVSLYVFTKVCAAGDPGSAVTVGGAGINRRIGLVFAVQDVNATTRYDVAGNNTSETATTTRTLASVTATLRDLPIAFATDRASSTVPASATWTWPTGFTGVYAGRTSAAINAGDVSLGIALGLPVAAGALMGGGNYIGDQAAGKSISIVAGFPSVAGS